MLDNPGPVIDILLMAIIIDGEIHKSEITAAKNIIANSKYEFTYESLKKVDDLHKTEQELINKNFKVAIETLNNLPLEEKKYILKLVTQITDADKVMHESEVKLISEIMEQWGL